MEKTSSTPLSLNQFPLRFEDALDVSPLDDGRNYRVIEPFYYDTGIVLSGLKSYYVTQGRWNEPLLRLTRIEVPAGFVTDFASIPQALWNLLPPTGQYSRAAVVHDFLYRTPGLATRPQADAVLYEAMKYPCKVGFFTRWTIYAGVRAGGYFSYKGGL